MPRLMWTLLAGFAFVFPARAGIDRDGNGLGDVWEAAHNGSLGGLADDDGDRFSNAQEAVAGTDPHDPASFPRSTRITHQSNGLVHVSFPTVAGVRYALEGSADCLVWHPVGQPIVGDGALYESVINTKTEFVGGGFTRQSWTGFSSGISVLKTYLTNGTQPHRTAIVYQLEEPQSAPDLNQFGNIIRGWLLPPETGTYTFWVASDDGSELWLSSNSSPSAKSRIAYVSGWTSFREWTKYTNQWSSPVLLEQGKSYYMEFFHRESTGGDHYSVAWMRPGSSVREIIAAPHVSATGQSLADLAGDGMLMFRLRVDQGDSDGDGVTDYEEELLGLNPGNPTTTPRQADLASAERTLDSENSVTVGASVPRAYEAEGAPGYFTLYRAGGIEPVTVHFSLSGTATSGVDYAGIPGHAHIPAGKRAVTVEVAPVPDGLLEPQEAVVLTLQPGTNYNLGSPAQASVAIDDAMDILYVAQLRPAQGVISSGYGLAAVRRAGNGLSGRVNLNFGGLSSVQVASEVFVSTSGNGGVVALSLPLDQVPPMDWTFGPSNGLVSADMLDALENGSMWIRIRSADHPDVELLGQFVMAPGWNTMPVPPSVPAPPSTAPSAAEAARFLTQATFGPREQDVTNLLGQSYASWIDSQLALPPTLHRPYVDARRAELVARDGNDGWQSTRQEAWWQHALTAPDQLRQRMAWALSQIFVISQFGALDSDHVGTTIYYDSLLEGAFGNYRDLLEKVTLSPMMGIYLSMMRNQKPDPVTGHEPDENYAREVMQLFSIGLTALHNDGSIRIDDEGMPIPTYDQDDIVGLAHIFTGWSAHYDLSDPPTWSDGSPAAMDDWFFWGWDSERPMTFYGSFHDAQDRTVVGKVTIPGSTNGVDRMRQALDILFNHPNVGPFMARQLIQRFVTSNPSPGYVNRVATVFNDNGSGVRGDLGATLKAVLLDYEARSPDVRDSISYGKPVEPLLRMTRMLRTSMPVAPFAANGDHRLFINMQWSLPEQAPLLAASVFNFYQPGYKAPGAIAKAGLFSPEFQIFAETTAIREANEHYGILFWGLWTPEPNGTNGNVVLRLNLDPLVAVLNTAGLTTTQAQARLLDHLDDRLLFGRMSPELRAHIQSGYAALPGWFGYSDSRQRDRVRMALYLIYNSPEFLVQK